MFCVCILEGKQFCRRFISRNCFFTFILTNLPKLMYFLVFGQHSNLWKMMYFLLFEIEISLQLQFNNFALNRNCNPICTIGIAISILYSTNTGTSEKWCIFFYLKSKSLCNCNSTILQKIEIAIPFARLELQFRFSIRPTQQLMKNDEVSSILFQIEISLQVQFDNFAEIEIAIPNRNCNLICTSGMSTFLAFGHCLGSINFSFS